MARLPMYRQIADAIREKISAGEYKVGEALPTEAQLRETYSVSRVTVRQAIKLLVESGELESKQGSGTYVKENKVNYDIYHQSSFAEKWSHLDSVIRSDVLAFEVTNASLTMAENLNMQKATRYFTLNVCAMWMMRPSLLKKPGCPPRCSRISVIRSCRGLNTILSRIPKDGD